MATGTVNEFNGFRGVGYITPDVGGEDVYVHWSQIKTDSDIQSLEVGQKVEYELIDDIVSTLAARVHVI